MSDVTSLDDTQIFDVLRVAFIHFRDNAALQLMCYLGLDPWMLKDFVSCKSDTDNSAHVRAKQSIKLYAKHFPDGKAYIPNALKNTKVSVDVLRRYMTLIAFTFTFGPYVVEKLNNNQSKVNSIFSLPLNQRTDTVELISDYVGQCFVDAYPNANMAQVKHRLLELGHNANKYIEKLNVKIQKLPNSVVNKPTLRKNVNIIAQLPKIIWENSSDDGDSPENDCDLSMNNASENVIAHDDNNGIVNDDDSKLDMLNDDLTTPNNIEGGITSDHESDGDGSVVDGNEEKTGFAPYIAPVELIRDKLVPPFDFFDERTTVLVIFGFIQNVLVVCASETISYARDARSTSIYSQYTKLLDKIHAKVVEGLLAILIKSNAASYTFRLQQCKGIFIDVGIVPSFPNAYVVDKFGGDPQKLWFPFNENLSTTDGIFPRDVSLSPPPKDNYVKDKLDFLGYSFTKDKIVTPSNGSNSAIQFTPHSDVYSVEINSAHNIVNRSPAPAPTHVPIHKGSLFYDVIKKQG